MKIKKLVAALGLAAAIGTGLTACGDGTPVAFMPQAYGENGHCYYVQYPAEVQTLYANGLCPRTWTPMLMPLAWHTMYASYYDAPAYYNTYIPVSYRSYYSHTYVVTFQRTYSTQIYAASSRAKWRGTNGSIKTGRVTTFNSGNTGKVKSYYNGGSGSSSSVRSGTGANTRGGAPGARSGSGYTGGGTKVRVGSGSSSYKSGRR